MDSCGDLQWLWESSFVVVHGTKGKLSIGLETSTMAQRREEFTSITFVFVASSSHATSVVHQKQRRTGVRAS